ncbi:MAG: T9SS type A sorting domain-containing protein [Flavobacteriales bacterium]|nr:T9SS type A sorting domain-containing protein [Flavobacteriales bacterium]
MRKILLSVITLLFMGVLTAQTEKCGTMQNLEEMMLKDPTLKLRMDSIEEQTQQWLRNNPNSRLKNLDIQNSSLDKAPKKDDNGHSIMSLCGNNNTYFTSITAPTTLNQVVSPSPNCTFGGEYVRVTGMIAGNVYRISTCGVNNFDTQLSIYNTSGFAVAHNDDACGGSQSEILFNPIVTETFDVLIDQYDCTSNSLCASLQVELIYTPRSVITIPVVVHVIHFGEPIGTGRNISDAQIQSQIDALNRDFRRYNTDIFNVPAAFRGVSDDPLIQFCLAQQDEFGNSTNGIKRWVGSQASWGWSDIQSIIKPSTIWDRNKYLNLWTLEFGGDYIYTLGYAQFPGGTANTDGVVIGYNYFGTVGNVVAPFNLGRTTTHEVGHWLNLRHIWGDANGCSTDDFVADTPVQDSATSGAPSFPITYDACSGAYPGINFYNYMDYSNDAITSMFTFGQAGRMDAALFGPRSSLLTSIGCQTPTGINESTTDFNVKIYPNPSKGIVNISFLETASNVIIEIYDLLGKQVHYQIISNISLGTVQTINLNEFVGGIYNVRITSDKNISNHKLLLTK